MSEQSKTLPDWRLHLIRVAKCEEFKADSRLAQAAMLHIETTETELADARAALNDYVWRDREQFPNDPYCAICGAGKAWAEKHGHETTCVLAKQG